jgi:hypothetical protein
MIVCARALMMGMKVMALVTMVMMIVLMTVMMTTFVAMAMLIAYTVHCIPYALEYVHV